MLGYRRKSFHNAHTLLREIVSMPEEVSNVLACERLLVQEITRAEALIQKQRTKLRETRNELKNSRPERSAALRLKRRATALERKIKSYQQTIYIWRCFGDGIAFNYLDKFALKHVCYETETVEPKSMAGFISGKDGFVNEWAIVESAARKGIPAILTDLTNTIRHGDICLLGSSDPYLIEFKSNERLNNRGRRQEAAIKKLHDFYEADSASNFRGQPKVSRVKLSSPECNYISEMNHCIERAEKDGYCVISPERGLFYAAIYNGRVRTEKIFELMSFTEPYVFFLNAFKSNQVWTPYYPFTLSIEKQQYLYDFIRGELVLMVVLDVGVVRQFANKQGYEVRFDAEKEYIIEYKYPANEGIGGVSASMINRIGLEFISPKWLLGCLASSMERWRGCVVGMSPES